MRIIKKTEEYRVNTEDEAKEAMEFFRNDAKEKDYILKASGYTLKQKKAKGEIVDEGYLIKVVKEIDEFWDI